MAQNQNNPSNNSTKLNISKPTIVNSGQNVPNLEGKTLLERYVVRSKLDKVSGEANLYRAYDKRDDNIDADPDHSLIVKQYRRKNGIKQDVLAKLQGLNSDNVVKILDYGEEQGFSFVVEPYYYGYTLRNFVAEENRLNLDNLKSIISILNDTLKTIHDQGIIHKDLKPDNIMLVDTDEGQNLVLIDFGISTKIDGQTIVVTQTGRSTGYAAPETYTAGCSIYSDYYSLGITIYELMTGDIPFTFNSEIYAQVQKIPYPKDFPQDFKDLIDGLTYKDISNRHDLNNPNRRWTYDEVNKWLRGEKQVVPGTTGVTNTDFQIPYYFKGNQIYNLIDLANEYYSKPDEAIKDIGRGFLSRHFEQISDEERRKYTEQAEKEITSNSPVDTYGSLVKLLYQITPNLKQILWKNKRFDNLTEYGNALIDEVVKNKGKAKEFIATAKIWLELDVLLEYAKNQINDIKLKESLITVFNNNKQLIKTVPLDELNQALRLGYSLTERNDFIIGTQSFKSVDDFNEYFDKLYNTNIYEYVKFFNTHNKELLTHEKLLVAEAKNKFKKHVAQKDNVITLLNGEYIFKNPLDVLIYLEGLYNQNQLLRFYSFVARAYQELTTSNKFINANKDKYNKIINNYKELIVIDEHIFKNLNELKEYATSLLEYKVSLVERFIDSHQEILDEYENSSNKAHKNILSELKQIAALDTKFVDVQKYSTNIKVGDVVKFGRYYQNNSQKKEAIEWIVLAKPLDNQALLISKYALDCKPYHNENTNVTWENCTLRKWCNGYFIENAFNEKEKQLIVERENKNNAGNNTKDKVFLLSTDEARTYFSNDNNRQCYPTKFALTNGAYQDNNRRCCWWLRSRGGSGYDAACINDDGIIYDDGIIVGYGDSAVRPAFLLRLT